MTGGKKNPPSSCQTLQPCRDGVVGTSLGIFSCLIHQCLSCERCSSSRKHLGVEWSWQKLG